MKVNFPLLTCTMLSTKDAAVGWMSSGLVQETFLQHCMQGGIDAILSGVSLIIATIVVITVKQKNIFNTTINKI